MMAGNSHGTTGFNYRSQKHEHIVEVVVGSLLYWAVVFLIIAIIGAALGFGGLAGTAMEGARLLFWIAIILFIISLVAGLVRRGRP